MIQYKLSRNCHILRIYSEGNLRGSKMKKIKIISIIALILSASSMVWGIGVATYYFDDLRIRAISTALLITSSVFVSNLVGLIFRESKKSVSNK